MKEKSTPSRRKVSKAGRSYPAEIKKKIVNEVQSGFLSNRAAARKYGLDRKTVDSWITEYSLFNLKHQQLAHDSMKEIKESTKVKMLSKQVMDLTKALEKAQLKIDGLETMIKVSEEELKVKIRKKPGAKQSRE